MLIFNNIYYILLGRVLSDKSDKSDLSEESDRSDIIIKKTTREDAVASSLVCNLLKSNVIYCPRYALSKRLL